MKQVYKLEDFPLGWEDMKDSSKRIGSKFRSFRLKYIKGIWIAQIRPFVGGQRKEIVERSAIRREAIERLDHTIERIGLYDWAYVQELRQIFP